MHIDVKLTKFQWDQVLSWLAKAGDKDQSVIGKKIKSFLPIEKKLSKNKRK